MEASEARNARAVAARVSFGRAKCAKDAPSAWIDGRRQPYAKGVDFAK